MENLEDNLSKLIQFLVDNGIKVNSMSRDLATFRRFFQIRINEEEENELEKLDIDVAIGGDYT